MTEKSNSERIQMIFNRDVYDKIINYLLDKLSIESKMVFDEESGNDFEKLGKAVFNEQVIKMLKSHIESNSIYHIDDVSDIQQWEKIDNINSLPDSEKLVFNYEDDYYWGFYLDNKCIIRIVTPYHLHKFNSQPFIFNGIWYWTNSKKVD